MLSEFRSTNITWDKATKRIYSPVTANASDENGRKLVVQIVNSGQVEDLTGATLHLYWETRDKLHDGLDVFKAVDLEKGEFELSYTTGMLSNKGVLNVNLVLIDTVGRVVSEQFKITVTEGIDDDAIQSENSFSSLTQALIDVSNLEQNYAPRLNDLTAQLQQKANQSSLVQTNTKVSGLDQRIDNLVIPISAENANLEVTDAHVSVTKGKTFDTLTHRFEENEEDINLIKEGSFLITNIIDNGGFTDGTNGWTGNNISVADNTLSIVGDTSRADPRAFLTTVPKLTAGHQYYVSVYGKVDNDEALNLQLRVDEPAINLKTISYPTANEWYHLDGIYIARETDSVFPRISHAYSSPSEAEGKTMHIKSVIAIDLDVIYGGNIPPIEEVREFLKSYPDYWFDGTINYTTMKEIYREKISKDELDSRMDSRMDSRGSLYDVYLRFTKIESSKNDSTITINPIRTDSIQLTRLYYLTPNDRYTQVNFNENEPYVLEHNEYLALDTLSDTIVKKNITLDDNDPSDKLLALNIGGDIVAGALRKHIVEAGLEKKISEIDVPAVGSIGSKGEFKFKFDVDVGTSYLSSHSMVGDELWVFTVSNDTNTNYRPVRRYAIDFDNNTSSLVGSFNHNWGHVNSNGYNKFTDSLIMGNGGSDYTLPGKIIIFENASSFKDETTVDIHDKGIVIDISSLDWGAKVNVTWGDSNNGKGNIAYVITNDNKNIRKILLGQGSTQFEYGQFITGKTGLEYNGTFKVLKEYNQPNGIDVNQGTCFVGGALYIGLGHNVLWYSKNSLHDNGTITSEVVREEFYKDDGTIDLKTMQGITVTDTHILVGLQFGASNEIYVYHK